MVMAALLPMKANSERVKGKNFREFCGKPLFRWILDTLHDIPEIDFIVINTDARDLLARNGLVESDRIRIRDRRPDICGDLISMNTIIADDVEHVTADRFLMTHTTNPLLQRQTIRKAIQAFDSALASDSADSLFTVNRLQTRLYDEACVALNHDPNKLIPTQHLPPLFEENSNLYLFTSSSFAQTDARIGQRPMMFECGRLESVDIDTEEDWMFAKAAASFFQTKASDVL